jgi:hypothetical protein
MIYMNYLYNLAYNIFDYILDFTLYYKICFQESPYFKSLYKYIYPSNDIVYAKLCNRNKILDITDKFTNIVQNGSVNWKDLLMEDMKNCEHFHLDIKYMINDNYFRIIYKHSDDNIHFPPYKQETIVEYNNSHDYKTTVLFAEINGKKGIEDITQLIKEYSGPLNNFYQDHQNINIHASLIKNDSGEYILIEDNILSITDSHVNDLQFNKQDILKLK